MNRKQFEESCSQTATMVTPLPAGAVRGDGGESSIFPIFIPEWARALRADWAPGPGVLVLGNEGLVIMGSKSSQPTSSGICKLSVKGRTVNYLTQWATHGPLRVLSHTS